MSVRELEGQVAAVTGAARGVGLAIARALLGAGARVAMLDIDAAAAARAAAGFPGLARGVAVDVSDESSVATAFREVRDALGPVGILVNNAGICGTEPFGDLGLGTWERTLAVNLTGAFLCMKAVLPGMVEAAGGRIVSVGSVAGRNGGIEASAAYATSKAGLAGLTRAAARQLARHGIRVSCVAPSTLETEMTAGWPEATRERIRTSVPLGRLGTVEDVAAAVLFLASPASSYITGVTLDVTGGLYMAP